MLENVTGVQDSLATIESHLRRFGLYHVVHVEYNPVELGLPVNRPRIYIVMLRKDICRFGSEREVLQALMEMKENAVQAFKPHQLALCDILLPPHHPAVKASAAASKSKMNEAMKKGLTARQKAIKWKLLLHYYSLP